MDEIFLCKECDDDDPPCEFKIPNPGSTPDRCPFNTYIKAKWRKP